MNRASKVFTIAAGIGTGSRFPVLVFLSLSILFVSGCESSQSSVDVGKKAPEINGEDMNGVPFALSQFQGKVVLIDFWASWCGPCMAEMPNTKELFRQYDTRPFAIIGISRDRTREDLKNFLDRQKPPWRNVFDAGGAISKEWNIAGFPTAVLVDHRGIIVGRWEGGGQSNDIHDAVDKAVREAEKK
jgi:peroxiredoxin